MNGRDGRLRSPRSAVLLVAALVTALVVAAGLLLIGKLRADSVKAQGEPMTDAQAAGQVVNAAKEIVETARLQNATGGYAFVSCKNENEPPYQAALYMNLRLPQPNSVTFSRDIAAAMVAHGWTPAASMGENFGQKLTKDGVTAIYYRNVNDADFATMRLYGECRNTADHRNDNPVWTEVSDQFR
jgi:hypothetical protein